MGVDDAPRESAFYFVVGSRETGRWSHAWRVWAGNTSFYIKPRDPELGSVKISGHGPDPRPGMRAGWKLQPDGPLRPEVVLSDAMRRGKWFDGVRMAEGARLVTRIRVPWFMLDGSLPNGIGATEVKKKYQAGLVAPPARWCAVDVDFYVSDTGEPFWPSIDEVRASNAALGPLRNKSGQVLTAAAHLRSMAKFPSPDGHDLLLPMNAGDARRGLFMTVPSRRSFAWIVETPISRTALASPELYRSPRVAPEMLAASQTRLSQL